MSSDNSNSNKPPSPSPAADMQRNRRNSVTTTAFSHMFRSNSTAATPVFPSAITAAAIHEQRRRLSLSTSTLGISGTSPTSATGLGRRASLSTNSSDLDENAIEEEDSPATSRTAPVTPFTRRVSFGTAAGMRRPGGTSPGTGNDQGFNWSEQLRSRAESTVASGSRPSFSFASGLTGSPPRPGAVAPPGAHDRTRSVSEMPAPPAQAPKPRSPPRDTRPKPDHFQERILKGDFYMD